jgi:hypothetical protein
MYEGTGNAMPKSLCNVCYKEIDASVEYRDNGVYLNKSCDTHGEQNICIEEDAAFYRHSLIQGPHADHWRSLINITALDVTQRCNVRCPHCYALPEKGTVDPSIDELIEVARKIQKGQSIILMGSEPTMRTDLPELINALKKEFGKRVGMYTNAIRLADASYCKEIATVIDFTTVSLHTRDYLPNQKLFDRKLEGIQNLFDNKVPIYHISFSLRTQDDLEEVFEHCKPFWGKVHHFRIRAPFVVGRCDDDSFYLSQLFQQFVKMTQREGMKLTVLPSDNNPYHVNLLVNNQIFRLIRVPGVEEVNLDYLQGPPYALFLPERGETNLVHQFILQEQLKRV